MSLNFLQVEQASGKVGSSFLRCSFQILQGVIHEKRWCCVVLTAKDPRQLLARQPDRPWSCSVSVAMLPQDGLLQVCVERSGGRAAVVEM